ncbi:hypothetical protein [Halorhabdus rudnickae]|uniref:hypothetical protein n=1 Tax=Halorhabdus rudnickae TaxID=1775544 RepID=UPI0010846B70|nr:hypothetical protein [Halorhabdus rudnickae]
MSAEHDQGSKATERSLSTEKQTGDEPRAGTRSQPRESGSVPGAEKEVRTAIVDRGGPPIENPSDAHCAVAASDRLWQTYGGGDIDGCFVWTTPDGDGGHWED